MQPGDLARATGSRKSALSDFSRRRAHIKMLLDISYEGRSNKGANGGESAVTYDPILQPAIADQVTPRAGAIGVGITDRA